MKTILIAMLTLTSASAFAGEFTCKSRDFNASKYDGQSLTVTLSRGVVIEIEKNEGSWYCASDENGKVVSKNPKLLSTTSKAKVYEAQFGCDEMNGRLSIEKGSKPTWAKYAFTFADDEGDRRITSALDCTAKR